MSTRKPKRLGIFTLKNFLTKVERYTALAVDTEEVVFEGEEFNLNNDKQIEKFKQLCKEMKLQENFFSGKMINFKSDKKIGLKATFYKPKGRANVRIKIEYTANFRRATEKPDEIKGIHQNLVIKYFPFCTPRVFRLDLFKDYLIKEKYWYLGIDKIFPCFYKNKNSYPNHPHYSPVRYASISMNNDNTPQRGFNDQFTENREKAMTHFTGGVYRRSCEKKYDKTASQKRLFLNKEITAEDYRQFIEEVGLTSFGEPNRVIRSELMLGSDATKYASTLIIEARSRGADQTEQDDLKKNIRSQYASQHRLVDTATIPKSGNIYEALTNEILEFDTDLNSKSKSKKEVIGKLALKKGLNEDALNAIAPLPTPKRTIESCAKSLAKELLRQSGNKKETILSLIENYIPNILKEMTIELKQEEYKSDYYYYSQKALIAGSEEERAHYIKQAQKSKEEGFLYHHIRSDWYVGDKGDSIDITKEIEESLLDTVIDNKDK